MSDRPWWRFWETYTSGTESPIDKRSSLVGTPSLQPCMGPIPNHTSTHCGTWRVPSLPAAARGVSKIFSLLFLGNGWHDCVKILYAIRVPLVTTYAVVTGGRVWNGLDQSAGFIIQSSPGGVGLDWIRNSPTQRILDWTGSRNVQCVSHI